MDTKPFTQLESKFIADYLRQRHNIPVKNGLIFSRMSPSKAIEWIKAGWQKALTTEEIARAARRNLDEPK